MSEAMQVRQIEYRGQLWNAFKLAPPEALVGMPDLSGKWDYRKDPHGPGTFAYQMRIRLSPVEFKRWLHDQRNAWGLVVEEGGVVQAAIRAQPSGVYRIPLPNEDDEGSLEPLERLGDSTELLRLLA